VNIVPVNSDAKVGIEEIGEGIGARTFVVPMEQDVFELIVPIKISTPDDSSSREHTLVIIRKSADTSLDSVQVNGNTGVKETDKWNSSISDALDTAEVEAVANCEFAMVKIEDGEFSKMTNKAVIDMTNVTTKDVKITVKAQDGTEEVHIVTITKTSNNANLQTVKVDNIEITPGVNGIYRAFVKQGTANATVNLVAEHKGAKIVVNEFDETVHTWDMTLNIARNANISC
jgi:hypothetical protein